MRSAFLLLLISLCCAPTPQRATADDSTVWHGVLKAPGRHMRLAVVPPTDAERADNTKAVLVSLDEAGIRLAMDSFQSDEETLAFEVKRVKAVYHGKIDGGQAKGDWRQGAASYPLTFSPVQKIPPRDVKRAWKGTLNAIVQQLDVAFVESHSGQIQFDSVTQRAGGFLVEGSVPKDGVAGEVELKVPSTNGVFKGEISEDGSELHGKWKQGFLSLTLNLKRVQPEELQPKAADAPRRPQTPQPPFPYDVKDIEFATSDPSASFKLAGTLCVPRDKCVAAIVLISGSGPQDRDETILEHKPFWVLADHMARHGIATLRYDDRGVGKSGGNFDSADTHDLSWDAEAAFQRLKQQFPNIPIGLCGHSEGGLIAPLVASRNQTVDFIVLLAGPGLRGDKILESQLKNDVLAPQLPKVDEGQAPKSESQQIAAALERTLAQQRQVLAAVMDAPADSAHDADQVAAKAEERWNASHPDDGVSEEERKGLQATAQQYTHTWFRTFLRLDPTVALRQVRCPVFALNGAKDVQVAAEPNINAIRTALEDHSAATKFTIYPELNHLFQRCQSGSVSEYAKIEETFNVRPLNDIVQWIHERADP